MHRRSKLITEHVPSKNLLSWNEPTYLHATG